MPQKIILKPYKTKNPRQHYMSSMPRIFYVETSHIIVREIYCGFLQHKRIAEMIAVRGIA